MNAYIASLGDRLRESREYLGLSQKEVSIKIGVSVDEIVFFESGKSEPDFMILRDLASLYQCPVAIFTDDDFSVTLDKGANALYRKTSEMTENDDAELRKFLRFLLMKVGTKI